MTSATDPYSDLHERLIRFAVSVVRLAQTLPRNRSGRHIAAQLLRSGSSPAANYAEARSAESRADFAHKLGVVLKELNESWTWLRIAQDAGLASAAVAAGPLDECEQLCRIIKRSLQTSRSRAVASRTDELSAPPSRDTALPQSQHH